MPLPQSAKVPVEAKAVALASPPIRHIIAEIEYNGIMNYES